MTRFDQVIVVIIAVSLVSGFVMNNRSRDILDSTELQPEALTATAPSADNGTSNLNDAAVRKTKPGRNITANKKQFFRNLLPLIERENARITHQREKLIQIQRTLVAGKPLPATDYELLAALSKTYRVSSRADSNLPKSENDLAVISELLIKVDQIPASLVLSQGANESAWGRSRFAKEANNYFGVWCFKPGCGIVPSGRPENAKYEVTRYHSAEESVRAYFRNINSHPAYKELRRIRAELRAQNQPITGTELAMGLMKYSSRGEAYIKELQAMIRFNQLEGITSKTL